MELKFGKQYSLIEWGDHFDKRKACYNKPRICSKAP